jgi:hypothetical protein
MQNCKSIHIKYGASVSFFCIKKSGYNGTGKVVSLQDIKAYGTSTVTAPLILTSALNGGESSTSCTGYFILIKNSGIC